MAGVGVGFHRLKNKGNYDAHIAILTLVKYNTITHPTSRWAWREKHRVGVIIWAM